MEHFRLKTLHLKIGASNLLEKADSFASSQSINLPAFKIPSRFSMFNKFSEFCNKRYGVQKQSLTI